MADDKAHAPDGTSGVTRRGLIKGIASADGFCTPGMIVSSRSPSRTMAAAVGSTACFQAQP